MAAVQLLLVSCLACAAQARFLVGRLPENPPVNETNSLDKQMAYLYRDLDCKGDSASFDSSANVFRKDFHPFAGKTKSVRVCVRGIFFYFDTPDMQALATLG